MLILGLLLLILVEVVALFCVLAAQFDGVSPPARRPGAEMESRPGNPGECKEIPGNPKKTCRIERKPAGDPLGDPDLMVYHCVSRTPAPSVMFVSHSPTPKNVEKKKRCSFPVVPGDVAARLYSNTIGAQIRAAELSDTFSSINTWIS